MPQWISLTKNKFSVTAGTYKHIYADTDNHLLIPILKRPQRFICFTPSKGLWSKTFHRPDVFPDTQPAVVTADTNKYTT